MVAGRVLTEITSGAAMTGFKGSPSISGANLAAFMLEQLASEQWINKVVWVVGSWSAGPIKFSRAVPGRWRRHNDTGRWYPDNGTWTMVSGRWRPDDGTRMMMPA